MQPALLLYLFSLHLSHLFPSTLILHLHWPLGSQPLSREPIGSQLHAKIINRHYNTLTALRDQEMQSRYLYTFTATQ